MSPKYLSVCCFLTCLLLAIFGQSHAEEVRSHDTQSAPAQGPKRSKLAGRAGNEGLPIPPAVQPTGFQQARERKLLSADERRALRRQVNETENQYPQKH